MITVNPAGATVLPSAVACERRATLPRSVDFAASLAQPAEVDVIDPVAIAYLRASSPRQMGQSTCPTVCRIGDGPCTRNGRGVSYAWLCTPKLGGWAQAVIVHGAGGKASHFGAAVQATPLLYRPVFIETTSAHVRAWAEHIGCASTLAFLPRTGPIPVQHRGGVH